MKGEVPVVTTVVALPLQPPLQDTFATEPLNVKVPMLETLILNTCVHAFASVIVHV